jgi:hypothetical protein
MGPVLIVVSGAIIMTGAIALGLRTISVLFGAPTAVRPTRLGIVRSYVVMGSTTLIYRCVRVAGEEAVEGTARLMRACQPIRPSIQWTVREIIPCTNDVISTQR